MLVVYILSKQKISASQEMVNCLAFVHFFSLWQPALSASNFFPWKTIKVIVTSYFIERERKERNTLQNFMIMSDKKDSYSNYLSVYFFS